MQPEFVKNDYFHRFYKTILTLARKGNAVFVGRRAGPILPRDMGLRVRIVAPLATRIKRLMERRGLISEAAAQEIQRLEEDRAEFTRRYFRAVAYDPHGCDLVINLQRFSVVQAVDLIESSHEMLVRDQRQPG